jgi:hypothetical protein
MSCGASYTTAIVVTSTAGGQANNTYLQAGTKGTNGFVITNRTFAGTASAVGAALTIDWIAICNNTT